MTPTKPLRFAALFDIHVGWDKRLESGRLVTRPTHNLPAIRTVLRFLEDWQPHAVILGGDQLNCGPISHWNHGKPRLVEGFRLKGELDLLDELVLSPLHKTPTKYWHTGNHEVWLNDFLDQNPSVEGLIEPEEYLRLVKRGWSIFSEGEVSSIGKLHFVHGDVALRNGRSARPAKKLVEAYNRSVRAGHLHTYDAYTQSTAIDRQDYHTGIIVPALASISPAYIKNNPNNFMQGFCFGTVFPDGWFSDYVAIINKGKFSWNNKVYDGNKS